MIALEDWLGLSTLTVAVLGTALGAWFGSRRKKPAPDERPRRGLALSETDRGLIRGLIDGLHDHREAVDDHRRALLDAAAAVRREVG